MMIDAGICRGILISLEIKSKSPEFLAEIFWNINYLMDFNEECVVKVLEQIPNMVERLCSELDYDDDRLQQSPVNRPLIRIIGNLLTIPFAGTD